MLLCQLQSQQQHTDWLLRILLQAVHGCLVPSEGRGGDAGQGRTGWQRQHWGRTKRWGEPSLKSEGKSVLRQSSTPGPELPQGGPGQWGLPGNGSVSPGRDKRGPGPPPGPTTWPPPATCSVLARPRRPISAQARSCRRPIGCRRAHPGGRRIPALAPRRSAPGL